ncbi:AdoMet_MTases domain containing protein [uncultured Caudovirales phage]|uniref:AdoMet_MTases domain containing protein n=1 Tax=uncultured Caudovirales phage TaxID=2100421 RepID=A0A6J5QGS8_9CAUD|nr:AdoMet_MTases domain containing protein [uncultured Caudovirales phage]CAB4169590.1 AdoMet_MTases domain containing protein [uncultured Caudovirales phage]CAB4175817.1 AdoMet_MTases domain containing protein [uncultured Caudovirales phage]CAB4181567.1 AdoMet_MTases domain containing protein [uncultured Caudovirales phage]CAB4191396.1 AdoMet_MTases domain containing protein [uncultured Caudovirales phage]
MSNIKFIGDLSIQDALILAEFAKKSDYILEFGSGGSTQIFAQCLPKIVISVETSPKWIEITQKRLKMIDNISKVQFTTYDNYPIQKYDLIFVDGVDELRRDFAIKTWELLTVDGFMIFHDTRRFADFQNATWIAQLFHNEINRMDINIRNSNMTVIHKKIAQPYVNWNLSEDKPIWAYGAAPNPDGDVLWPIEN